MGMTVICFHNNNEENGYLSNWYPSTFTHNGITFSSMEQYMMYRKALSFGDEKVATQILATDNAAEIKALGRLVSGYDESLWNGIRQIVVYRAEDGRLFLVVHSGSRHLGTEVANFYQDEGRRALWGGAHYQIKATIDQMKAEGRFKEIQKTITALKREHDLSIPKDLAYVEGALFDDYIHDMKLTQKFAILNRKAMVDVILSGMGLTPVDEFTTIHNYIDTDAMILRKGSVSARKGEKLLIPINMRDGSLICIGKGNEEWNCSAPHGAGRLMSRHAAFQALSMEEFQKEMEGIYTTCVVPDTLDESPMAYKSMDEIIDQIEPTVEIVQRIRPVYNFKASD